MRLSAPLVAAIAAWVPFSAQAGFKCPARGGSEWRQYRSSHFLLQTDVTKDQAARLITQLESMHALELQALVGEQVQIPGRLRVIALADPRLFQDLAGRYEIGGYYKRAGFGQPTIVIPIDALDAEPQTLAHELAHHLSFFLFVRQPMWFTEGIAQFVQTIAASGRQIEPPTGSHIVRGQRDHSASVGAVPVAMAGSLQESPKIAFRQLLDWNGREERRAGSYHLYSWLLYHWLWNTRSKEFSAYQQRLSDGDDPAAAWRASFPDLDPANAAAAAKLEDALEAYRRTGRYLSYRVTAASDASFDDEGPLSSADAHMVVDDAAGSWSSKDRLDNAEEALREDASQPAAIVVRARAGKEPALPSLRKAVATRPGDWRAWFALGGALGESEKDEKLAAYRKAVSLNPDSASAHNDLAWVLVTQGRAQDALPIANRALDLAPFNPNAMDTLATVAAELGKCAEALVLERRAAGMLPPESEFAARFAKKIAEWQAGCGKGGRAEASANPAR